MTFNPYLFFGGNCRDAFTRYQEIFGGDLQIMSMGDAPEGEGMAEGSPDLVMHAAITLGDEMLMGSDDPTSDTPGPVQGMMISYSTADPDEAKRVFEALAEGGDVTQPMIETFFSPAWGMVTDRFGTPWMVGADQAT